MLIISDYCDKLTINILKQTCKGFDHLKTTRITNQEAIEYMCEYRDTYIFKQPDLDWGMLVKAVIKYNWFDVMTRLVSELGNSLLRESRHEHVVNCAIEFGRLNILKWMHANTDFVWTLKHCHSAVKCERNDIFEWMHNSDSIKKIISGHRDIIRHQRRLQFRPIPHDYYHAMETLPFSHRQKTLLNLLEGNYQPK